MKTKVQLSLIFFMMIVLPLTQAQGSNSSGTFKSVDEEVALEIERGTGEVKLLISIKDPTQYHHIVVERSAETPNYFGKCKYISCSNLTTKDAKITDADRYPYSAVKNVYYRIKTVTNDGIERAYPAVLLPAISQ